MRIGQIVVSGCMFAALTALPAAASAARECVVQKPGPASYTWNFKREATNTFDQIAADAARARFHAERLQTMVARADSLSWPSDLNQLNQIRSAVNDMGSQVCRLETIRRMTSPWQRKTIDHIVTDVTLLADNTRDAQAFGDTHREGLWIPVYDTYVNNLYTEAKDLTRSVRHAVKYAKVAQQDRMLRNDFSAKASS